MFSWEEIEEMNPPEPGSKISYLQHLIAQGATTPESLCIASDILQNQGPPFVLAFCQLPFPVDIGSDTITIQGSHKGIHINFEFIPKTVQILHPGKLQLLDLTNHDSLEANTHIFVTQIIATIRLWGWREPLYSRFTNYVSFNGLKKDGVIDKIRSYMELPDADMQYPERRAAPLTASRYQDAIAKRLLDEMHLGVQKFIRAYSAANLDELPMPSKLYGFFVMLAPGLVGARMVPPPLLEGLCQLNSIKLGTSANKQRIERILAANINFDDRVIKQFMAMQRLMKDGEPELALVGCISAIEWFLNDSFPNVRHTSPSGNVISASINKIIDKKLLSFLSDDLIIQLRSLSCRRNEIVHGTPPHRGRLRKLNTDVNFGLGLNVQREHVQKALTLGLEVYREVNAHKSIH